MIHLAYFGVGLLVAFFVALFPALLTFSFDLVCWWAGGKTEETPRLTKDYGSMWLAGLIGIAILGVIYSVGYGAFALIHHIAK